MTPKTIPIAEFRQRGYLQELNRRFLHPLGMALAVTVNDDGTASLDAVWDARDDREGWIYGPGMIDADKAAAVDAEWAEKAASRQALLGWVVQPVEAP